jgi:hypothetical protein
VDDTTIQTTDVTANKCWLTFISRLLATNALAAGNRLERG